MYPEKRKRLEAAGYQFGDYAEFLGLSKEEKAAVEKNLSELPRCEVCGATAVHQVVDTIVFGVPVLKNGRYYRTGKGTNGVHFRCGDHPYAAKTMDSEELIEWKSSHPDEYP